MKAKMWLLVVALTVLTAGCSSISVRYDYDKTADFQSYKTYAWLPQPTTSTSGSARHAIQRNSLLDKRILAAVNTQMTEKGLRVDTEDPDLLLMYHTGVEDKVNVTDWGYSYPYHYGGWYYGGGRDIDVTYYQEGTLILDFIDGQSKELVWRGMATAALSSNPTPESSDKQINNAVAKMLNGYPPKIR